MKYSLRILKNKNIFKRLKCPSPNALNIKYFWTLCYNYWKGRGGGGGGGGGGGLGVNKLSNP